MCGVRHERFVLPTEFPVWGALLAGGLLGEARVGAAAVAWPSMLLTTRVRSPMRTRLGSKQLHWKEQRACFLPPILPLTLLPLPPGYLYQLALTGGLQRARAAPAVAMSYLS